jgi:aspartate oxidase
MKSFSPNFIILILILLTSCVPAKKYKASESRFLNLQEKYQDRSVNLDSCRIWNAILREELEKSKGQSILFSEKIEALKRESKIKDDKLKIMEDHLSLARKSNEDLSNQVDQLHHANQSNAELMQKMLEEMELKNLKVLNLSLALQQQDSMNIHLVKKTRSKISEKKLRKSLEKLGFVFY